MPENPASHGQPPVPLVYGPPPRPASWLLPPPPRTGYDHLARNAVNAWWRPLAGTLLVGTGFFLVGLVVVLAGAVVATVAGIPMPMRGQRLFGDPVFGLAVLLLSVAAVLPVVYAAAALVQRRPPGTVSSVAGRLRWGWLAWCTGLAVAALVVGQIAMTVAYAVTGEQVDDLFGWTGWGNFLPALAVIVVLVPFQAAAEEYIFRGWVLQAFGAVVRSPWPGIVLGAAAFTALHGYTDWGILDVFGFGVLMGWLAVRTGGLEAAIAMHVVNNLLAFGLSAAAGKLDEAMEQGTVPWQSLVGTVVQLGVFATGVVLLAKRRSVHTISG
jgi:membrane protease YdiL (CAAX protease family)